MIYYNCGKSLSADDKICPDCGTENIVTEEELAIDKEISKKSKKAKKPLKNPKKMAIVALVLAGVAIQLPVVVGVALAIIALVFAIRVRNESDDAVTQKLAKVGKILSIAAIVWSCVATALAAIAIVVAFLVTVFSIIAWLVTIVAATATFLFTDLGDAVLSFFAMFA